MPNNHLAQRLQGLQTILNGVHQSNASMSAASKGSEREAIIDQFLSRVLPPIYRFGNGDATDISGARSGQLDVVVEYPFSPTLPSVGSGQSRLYLAESVAAVVEVKSDLANQWNEAERTGDQLSPLRRSFGATMSMGKPPAARIPLFALGYTGWKTRQALEKKLYVSKSIQGALVIDAGLYVSKSGISIEGPEALWGLIVDLHRITNSLQSASTDPSAYLR